jgi:hypothetical protein
LVLPHLPPLDGQDCNLLMLVTLWLLVGEVLGLGILPHKVAVVRVVY